MIVKLYSRKLKDFFLPSLTHQSKKIKVGPYGSLIGEVDIHLSLIKHYKKDNLMSINKISIKQIFRIPSKKEDGNLNKELVYINFLLSQINDFQFLIIVYQFNYQPMLVTIYSNEMEVLKNNNNFLPIIASQLNEFNREGILKFLEQKKQLKEGQGINIITKSHKDYHIDRILYQGILLSEKMLPLQLEVIYPVKMYQITSLTEVSLDYFNILVKIGQGTYAEVFLIQKKYDRSLFCLKRINKTQCLQKASFEVIKNQQSIMREVRGNQMVKLYYSFEDSYYVYLVMQYCPYGDLKNALHRGIPLKLKYQYFIEICLGINYLHARGIVYRDIKPQNILIDVRGRAKLCDFGFACRIAPFEWLKEICGSYQYIAPEIINKTPYNHSIDLYCLGLFFYEMIAGINPFAGTTPANLEQIKQKQIIYDKKKFENKNLKSLIERLLKKQAEERVGYKNTQQIFLQPFFKENQDLVMKILGGQLSKPEPYQKEKSLHQRNQVVSYQPNVLAANFNFLKPNFNVTQKIGPKFNFNF